MIANANICVTKQMKAVSSTANTLRGTLLLRMATLESLAK